MNTYKEYYQENVVPALMERFKFKSNMEAPRLIKITLNMGLGSAIADKKILEKAQDELTQIAGQKAVLTYAKKSIANFKLREGMPIGCKVTLRGQMMYDFFEKLIKISLPRTRDFRGYSEKSFDGRGNYTLGIREDSIFPEISGEIDRIRGFDITFVTSKNTTDQESHELLSQLGMPFRKK